MAAAAFFNAAKLADAVGRVSPVVGNIFRYLATMVTGADDKIVTGTAGTSGNVIMWDANGDAVDGSVAASSLTAEAIQDLVGAMVSGNTETLITVTYQDSDGTIDFEITDAELTALSGVTSAADRLFYFTGLGTGVLATYTASARTFDALTAVQGDLIYGSAAATFSALAKDTNATRSLTNTGASNNPAWAQVALATGVSGVLPTANGGTSVDIASAALPLGSGQITFPATQNASADANTLDDYEEGTWTPTLQDSSFSDSESQAYSVQVGRYVKTGLVVNFWGRLTTSSIGTLTGAHNARIAGLPFTAENTTNLFGLCALMTGAGLAITAGFAACTGVVTTNATNIQLRIWDAATGTSNMTVTQWSADGDMTFAGSYRATG